MGNSNDIIDNCIMEPMTDKEYKKELIIGILVVIIATTCVLIIMNL